MDRTARQRLCIKKWIESGGKASIIAATGFGKTRVGLEICKLVTNQKRDASILVVVPTQVLKEQWQEKVDEYGLSKNVEIQVINTVIKHQSKVDLLVQDECHRYASETFKEVFTHVDYSMVLCLTGTLERLDGKEEIIKEYAPVCDEITMDEAINNGWISKIKEYAVLLDVDLTEYDKIDRKFNSYFSLFAWDFSIAMKCMQDRKYRSEYAKATGVDFKTITTAAFDWMHCLHARKKFIESHPKKLEIANLILSKRKDKKCIVFASKIDDLNKINLDYVLHSKQKKKDNSKILEEFNNKDSGSIGSSKALNEGVDVKGLNTGIILNTNSSKITKTQVRGRICRFEEGKEAEMFTILIAKTKEINWFANSNSSNVTYITEDQLLDVLNGKEVHTRQRNFSKNIENRF